MKMRTRKNLAKHELIGLEVEVIESSDKSQVGIKGRVVDETKNTLVIEDRKEKTVPKKNAKFRVRIDDETIEIKGNKIAYAPENRIKKARKV